MINSRSVTFGDSLSISQKWSPAVFDIILLIINLHKSVYWYGMVNVDLYSAIITKVSNALLTSQQLETVSVRNTQVFLLSGEFCIYADKSVRRLGCVTINNFTCHFAKCLPILKILSPANWMVNL